MPDYNFETNIMRFLAAQLYFSVSMQTAREMYGESYFSLGAGEKLAVDQMVFGQVSANYLSVTPEKLRKQTPQQPAGFQVPTAKTGQS